MAKRLSAETVVSLIDAGFVSANGFGTVIDLKDFDEDIILTMASKEADSGALILTTLDHSDDGSTGWATYTSLISISPAAAAFTQATYDTKALRRYIRVGILVSGTTSTPLQFLMRGFKKYH